MVGPTKKKKGDAGAKISQDLSQLKGLAGNRLLLNLNEVLEKNPEIKSYIFDSKRQVEEFNKKFDRARKRLAEDPPKRIAEILDNYSRTRVEFKEFVKERSARLDRLGFKRLERLSKWLKSEKKGGNPVPVLGPDYPPSIFDVVSCTSEFDPTEIALKNNRGRFYKDFYKVLLFNNRLDPTYVRRMGWLTGMILRYRQEWRPGGFVIGDLVQSFSLMPGEKMNIEMSVWEKTRHEIEQTAEEATRETLEKGSKTTDAEQISEGAKKARGWHVDANVGISLGYVSASVGGGYSSSVEKHSEKMVSEVQRQTESSASEISHTRSVRVTTTQESGREDRVVREISNPNVCHTVTYNFFQLLKRYDLVMTYQDSPLCLIYPHTEKIRSSDIWELWRIVGLNYALWESDHYFSFMSHWLKWAPEIAGFLSTLTPRDPLGISYPPIVYPPPFDEETPLGFPQSPGYPRKIFGEPMVLEFITHDPEAIFHGLELFFDVLWTGIGNEPDTPLTPADRQLFADLVAGYSNMDMRIRKKEQDAGEQIVDFVEVLTPALYVDAMIGVCSACEDYINLSRSNQALKDFEDARQVYVQNELLEKELLRRKALLDKGVLDPFEPPPRKHDEDDEEEERPPL